jgi:hypothetical protein
MSKCCQNVKILPKCYRTVKIMLSECQNIKIWTHYCQLLSKCKLLYSAVCNKHVACNVLGCSPGVCCLIADVSEHCVRSIFIGEWIHNIHIFCLRKIIPKFHLIFTKRKIWILSTKMDTKTSIFDPRIHIFLRYIHNYILNRALD